MLSNKENLQKRIDEIQEQRRKVKNAEIAYKNDKTSENFDKVLKERKAFDKIYKISAKSKTKVNHTQEELREVMDRFENTYLNDCYEESEFSGNSLLDLYNM